MLWLWLWGLPQSDKIYTVCVCSLVHWACGLSLEFIFSAPDFYLIKGEKTVSSLRPISGKAGGGLDEKFSWKKLTSWPVASWKC